jgi:2'-5' RNA ligase
MIRAFIAIEIPDDVREKVAETQSKWKRVAPKLSWTKPENWHLTLKFLAYINEEQLPAVQKSLEKCAESPKFSVEIAGAGAFPSLDRPRVLWVGCRDASGALKKLAENVETELERVGFPREARGFAGHLTLARVKVPKPDPALTKAVQSDKDTNFGTVNVEAIHLFESQLQPTGAKYIKISSHELKGT